MIARKGGGIIRKCIKYVVPYDVPNYKFERREYALSAKTKVDYICSVLINLGYDLHIISPAGTSLSSGFYSKRTVIVNNNTILTQSPTFGVKTKFGYYLKTLLSIFWLFLYLVLKTKKNEIVIYYHVMFLDIAILAAKKIKNFQLLLEVEEIYQNVAKYRPIFEKTEIMILRDADKYIFSTELLNDRVNQKKQPYCIIYGTYGIEKDRECSFKDNKTHVVYAGTFDASKGAAHAATAALYLPETYHLHIAGFGNEDDQVAMQYLVSKINRQSKCNITYWGRLEGEEYIRFLQSCQIGLSTQMPDAGFNDTSFPSKILSYMTNGLTVVSIRMKALERSSIADAIHFYEEQTSKAIAEAIMLVHPFDSRKMIEQLNNRFVEDIKSLLK